MPTISGNLNLVTDRPVDSISEVWVRARETRGQGDGLTVGVNDRVPVTDGAVEFTALPGAAVLVLVQNGMPLETLPMLVGDEAQQSLRLVVQAGEVAGAADKSVIEQLAAEIAANTARTEQYRTEAAASASAAQASQSAASKSASNAKTSETNAASSASASASSASSSKTQADKSAASEAAAAGSAAAAKTSETNANTHEQAAATSASNAAASETSAGESATAAAGSATEAKGHAERAEQAADPTGLRNEVMQQLANLVDGAPEDLDTIREVAEYAQANRGITDQLNAAIGNKANKSHTHVSADITDATSRLGRPSDYYTADKLVRTNADGQLTVYTTSITEDSSVANKNYVDIEFAKKADKSHTHAWSSITQRPNVPVTDAGYGTYTAEDTPDAYPAGVSVTMSRANQGWNQALTVDDPDYVNNSFVVVLTIKTSNYVQSTTQMLFSYTDVTRPVYIRKSNNAADGWTSFRKFSDDGHKHSISQVTGLQSELDSRPSMQARWSYCGRADSSATNWVFTPIPLPGAPKLSNGDQRINADVSGMWEVRLTCTDPNRQVEIFTSKGSVQGTGSCFTIVNLADSDYITSYRYGAADGTKIVLDMIKLD